MTEKYNINETKDVFNFGIKLTADLVAAKQNDGTINVSEWLTTAITNAPDAVKAAIGANKIPLELKDLDSEESKELAALGVQLGQNFVQLLMSFIK